MSLSLCLVPNNLGPFFFGSVTISSLSLTSLTAITINATTINATTISSTTMRTSNLDTATSGGGLIIGGVNAGTISFGNGTNSTNCRFDTASKITFPGFGINSPYNITTSAIEVSTTINLTGAVNTGVAKIAYRKIGNWVDLYIFNPGAVSPGITNTLPITLVGALASGYRPADQLTFSVMVIDSGVTPNDVTGECTIALNGDISISRLGPTNWTSAAVWGFRTITISYAITL